MHQEKIDEWIKKHGKLTAVFIQVKLKITYQEALKILQEIDNKNIENIIT